MVLDIKNSRFDDFLTFWVLEPRISSFYYTKLFQINQGKSGNILGKYYLWKYDNQNFRNFRNLGNLRSSFFEFLKF